MVTTVQSNTFEGPNNGQSGGYIPHSEISSDAIDADFTKIFADLDYHLYLFQTIFAKLDQLDPVTLNTLTPEEVLNALNGSSTKISKDNLDDLVVLVSELNTVLETHRTTTNNSDMHPESAIQNTGLSYSYTPGSLITTCMNLLDELKNIRYQINRIVGKTNWTDTPDMNIASLKTAINADIANLTAHINNNTPHVTVDQNAAMLAANSPSGNNAFATMADLNVKGAGDMLKATYDANGDNVVDKATALVDGAGVKTYQDIATKISTDIAAHAAATGVSQYTDALARGAVHNDPYHSSQTVHDYNDLINKPSAVPAGTFTTSHVNYMLLGKLANGTTPWTQKADLIGGYISFGQCQNILILGDTWDEYGSLTNSYYSATTAGSVYGYIVGPAFIYGGIATATRDFGYVQIGVNNTNYVNCSMSAIMMDGPGASNARSQTMWYCPQVYVPAGKSFYIKVGSSHSDENGTYSYGAGFYLKYRPL